MPSKKKKSPAVKKTKLSWKTVELEDGHIARGIPRDMIGIEELTDYKLVKGHRRAVKSSTKIIKQNSKTVSAPKDTGDQTTTVLPVTSSENGGKSKVVKKLKKTKKPKKNLKVKPSEETPAEDASNNDEAASAEVLTANNKLEVNKNSNEKTMKSKKRKTPGETESEPPPTDMDPETASCRPKLKAKNNLKTKKNKNETTDKKEETAGTPALEIEESITEPIAKRSKEEEQEETRVETTVAATEEFEITPDMIIWKAMYLPDSMVRAVWELGFHQPTAIQLAVLPTAMKGRKDVVGAAETGSGKTLAFGIPILNGILKDKDFERRKAENADYSESNSDGEEQREKEEVKDPEPSTNKEGEPTSTEHEEESDEEMDNRIGCVRVIEDIDFGPAKASVSRGKLRALIVTPTRELAVQIEKHLKAVAKYTGITMALVIGGMAAPKQERILSKGPDIVIGTPGRLWELIELGNPHLSQVTDIRYLALDETDRLLEKGHFAELHSLLEHINKDEAKKRWRQNFVFSATLTLAHDLPQRLGHKKKPKKKDVKLDGLLSLVNIRPKAKIVDLTSATKQFKPASLSEMKLFSATLEDKDFYLYYFLRNHKGRTLVFCNSINNVRRLTSVFTLLEMNPFPLHAQMHQKQRLKHLEKFSGCDNSLLIATDVAARGLDIPNIQNVVHFQVPRSSENYVHRSGRTARASRDGLSLMLIEPGETGSYRQLCNTLNKQKTDLPDYDVDMRVLSAVKQRVNLARSIETLEHRTKRDRSDEGWLKKMAEEADIIVDDNGYDSDDDPTHELAKLTNDLKIKRRELSALLSRPLKRSVT